MLEPGGRSFPRRMQRGIYRHPLPPPSTDLHVCGFLGGFFFFAFSPCGMQPQTVV